MLNNLYSRRHNLLELIKNENNFQLTLLIKVSYFHLSTFKILSFTMYLYSYACIIVKIHSLKLMHSNLFWMLNHQLMPEGGKHEIFSFDIQ